MQKTMRYAFIMVVAVLVLQASAMGAVTITWAGGNSINLTLISNPDVSQESWWPQVWYGELPISMTTLNPIVFSATGNFNDLTGSTVDVIRLKQVVTNNTNKSWTDFHIRLSGGTFYKKWLVQQGWSVEQSDNMFDYYAYHANGAPVVAPGEIFTDGVELIADTDSNGDGTFTLTKWPTVPEAGSALALLTGFTGFFTFRVRRRA